MTVQRIYESGEVAIRPGDTVVDCGAHVGLFTKLALKQGADRVVAIEPDPANVACLESNLGPEIAEVTRPIFCTNSSESLHHSLGP